MTAFGWPGLGRKAIDPAGWTVFELTLYDGAKVWDVRDPLSKPNFSGLAAENATARRYVKVHRGPLFVHFLIQVRRPRQRMVGPQDHVAR